MFIEDIEKQEAFDIMSRLLNKEGFDEAIETECTLWDWYNNNRNLCVELGIEIHSGATKVVIIFDDFDWVIKIPFVDPRDGTKDCQDYCELEYENYVKAVDNNLQEYFAEVMHFGAINDIELYAQVRVYGAGDTVSEDLYNNIKDQMEDDRDCYDTEDDFIDAVASTVDELDDDERIYTLFGEESGNLVEFVEMLDINDLHSGNFGYVDGKPVIMDYSGF